MAQSKATKKFEKRHLKDTIKRRKEVAKIKQRNQLKTKKKAHRAKENDATDEATTEPDGADAKANGNSAPYGDMSVDDFFQGGFDIPDLPKQKSKKSSKVTTAKTGKRKRTSAGDQGSDEDEDSSDASVEHQPILDDPASDADGASEMGDHKQELAALAEKDPEFYKFLQEDDPELLNFAEDADLAEIDALSGSEDEETPKKKRKTAKDKKKDTSELDDSSAQPENDVTKALVKKWRIAMTERQSLRSTREVVLAFRSAAHLNDDEGKQYKYSISNPDAYHELLIITLNHIPEVIQHHLPIKESNNGKIRVPTESKKYKTLTPLLKSHVTSVHHLLENLSDDATLRLTLSSLLSLLPYILSFKKLVRDISRTVVDLWSDPANNEATRIAAFLVLRRLVVIGDPGIKEAVLKAAYQGLIKGSRNMTMHTAAGVELMKTSAAELWALDPNVGYTTGFTFIRQLAVHLRSSITNRSKDSYKTVYNWQYVHSLDFWCRMLSVHCDTLREAENGKESPLRPLIYPVVQVTIGALRLIPTAQYFPLRFQLIRSLLRVSQATSTYIPLAPALYEVLNSAEMKKAPKPSTLKPLDFSLAIRAAKSYLRTRVYQDGVGEQVTELLSEFFVLWSKNVAFPELALPIIVMLKRWLKEVSKRNTGNKNSKVNSTIALVVQKLESNSRWIEERRVKVDFAPDNRAGVEGFLKDTPWEKTPLGAYVVGQRKTRAEKARVMLESRKVEQSKKEESDDDRVGDFDGAESEEEVASEESNDEDEEEEEEE